MSGNVVSHPKIATLKFFHSYSNFRGPVDILSCHNIPPIKPFFSYRGRAYPEFGGSRPETSVKGAYFQTAPLPRAYLAGHISRLHGAGDDGGCADRQRSPPGVTFGRFSRTLSVFTKSACCQVKSGKHW